MRHIVHEQVVSRADDFYIETIVQFEAISLFTKRIEEFKMQLHISLLISDDDQSSIQCVHF